jgi:Uncharacterised protein conserved in bacteria (DUF2313)
MLRNKFPSFYENCNTMIVLWDAEDKEVSSLQTSLESMINQAFIGTTDQEISRWEKIYGLPIRPSIPLEDRISTVKAKMRGIGVVNAAQIKRTADAFTNGDVDVIEKSSTYEVEIKFVSIKGIPPSIDDTKKAISAIIPAHIKVTYTFAYLVWNELENSILSFDSLETYTWDSLETATL